MSYPRQNNHFCSLCLPHNIFQDYKIETVSSYVSREASSLFNKWGKKDWTSVVKPSAFRAGVLCGAEASIHWLWGERKKDKVKEHQRHRPLHFRACWTISGAISSHTAWQPWKMKPSALKQRGLILCSVTGLTFLIPLRKYENHVFVIKILKIKWIPLTY